MGPLELFYDLAVVVLVAQAAHHLSAGADGQRTLMIASIRYLDEFVKQDGGWLFAERRLMVDWTETRPSAA